MCTKIDSFRSWMKVQGEFPRKVELTKATLLRFKMDTIARATSMLSEVSEGFEKARRGVMRTTEDAEADSALLELQNAQCAQIIQSLQDMLEKADGEFVSMLMERDDDKKKAM